MTTKAKKVFLFFGILTGLVTACLGLETHPSNHLGWALLFTGTGFTAIGCLYLGFLSIQPGIEEQHPGDRSLWLPCLGGLAISLITPFEYLFLPPVLPRTDYYQDVGIILFAGGLAFFLLSLQSHKPWESPILQPPARGFRSFGTLSRMIFCPISASLLLCVLGLGIGYSSWLGLLAIFILVLPGLFRRMRSTG